MNKRNLAVLAAVLLVAAALGVRKETVGAGEIGLRTTITGAARVYQAGDKVLLFPGLTRLLRFSARPVRVELAGDEAIRVNTAGGGKKVEAMVRYRLRDPARLVKRFGSARPEESIRAEIKKILSRRINEAAKEKKGFMATVPDRVLLTARLLESLSAELEPAGIAPMNLDIRLAGETKKPV